MFEILSKRQIAPQVWRYSILAPAIAPKRLAGNFVILRPVPGSERIPLTLVTSDPVSGSVDIIFQVVGLTTEQLAALEVGQTVSDIVGPLGHPTPVELYGRVVMIGGGVGIAPLFPIAQAFHDCGNHLTTILGARSSQWLILESELASVSDRLWVATDDGSRGQKGLVTDLLKPLLQKKEVDFVFAVGPVLMMKAVSELTRPYAVKTLVSLNPLMIDGTGMCGVCRCNVNGKTRFACVDGPEFDGHQVDFDSLHRRLAMFKQEERRRWEAASHAS